MLLIVLSPGLLLLVAMAAPPTSTTIPWLLDVSKVLRPAWSRELDDAQRLREVKPEELGVGNVRADSGGKKKGGCCMFPPRAEAPETEECCF